MTVLALTIATIGFIGVSVFVAVSFKYPTSPESAFLLLKKGRVAKIAHYGEITSIFVPPFTNCSYYEFMLKYRDCCLMVESQSFSVYVSFSFDVERDYIQDLYTNNASPDRLAKAVIKDFVENEFFMSNLSCIVGNDVNLSLIQYERVKLLLSEKGLRLSKLVLSNFKSASEPADQSKNI